MPSHYYELVFRSAVELLRGSVLQAGDVSAGNGDVIDWRKIRSGELVPSEGSAYSQAVLFVELAGIRAVGLMFRSAVAIAIATTHATANRRHGCRALRVARGGARGARLRGDGAQSSSRVFVPAACGALRWRWDGFCLHLRTLIQSALNRKTHHQLRQHQQDSKENDT